LTSRVPRWNPLERSNPLAPLYLSVFLFTVAESALHVLVPPYLSTELELGPAAIGAVVSVFAIAALVTRLPAGALYSVARSRVLVLVGGAVSALAFGLVPAVDGVAAFAALMALDGFGLALVTTTQLALLAAIRPPSQPLASALGWFAGFQALGHVVAGTLGGLTADRAGFDTAFLLFAGLTAVATLLIVRGIARATRLRNDELSVSRTGAGRLTFRAIGALPMAVWTGVLVLFTMNFLLSTATTFYPLLALGAGITLTQIGILATCRSSASSVVRLGSGPLFSRVSAENLTLPLVVLAVASVALLPSVASSFALTIPLFVAAGLSRGLLRVTGSAQALGGVDQNERSHGLASAFLYVGLDLGRIVGPLVAGGVAQAFGLTAMFRVLPVAMLALYLPLALAGRRATTRRAPSPSA
jgi:predicted MFS family arabinose efflux permease